jgi:hypothetical protein
MPALPLDEAGQYVAGAYVVFLLLILIYVAIIGSKVARIQRQVAELLELTDEPETGAGRSAQPARSSEAGGRAGTSAGESGGSAQPARSREAGGRESSSGRGAGSPAEVIARGPEPEAPR